MPPDQPAASPADSRDPGDPRDARIAELEARLDDVAQQLLQARDAAVGAEAELSVARARIAEIEHHLHVRIVEVTELQRTVLELTGEEAAPGDRPNPVARRLSPLLARSARLQH